MIRSRSALQVGEISYPAHLYQARHAHAEASVTLVLAGSIEERVGGRTERGLALGVVVKPSGVEHDDRFGARGARTVQIGVSADACRALERRGEVLERWRWLPAGPASAAFLRLIERLQDGGADPGEIQDRGWEVLAALGRGARPGAGPGRRGAGAAPRWLAEVRERVSDAPTEPHRVRALADAAGVHPVHLAREFRRHYGESVSEHLQHRRLQAAAELLAASDAPIASVAARAGFADQSHLGRQLRARTGFTPARLRRTARSPMLQAF